MRQSYRFLPAVILMLGITVHGIRIIEFDADPQAGSAFAMFSSVDMGATRQVIATTTIEGHVVVVKPPSSMDDLIGSLKKAPSLRSALELKRALGGQAWDVAGDVAVVGGKVELRNIRVQVVGLSAMDRTLARKILTDTQTEVNLDD